MYEYSSRPTSKKALDFSRVFFVIANQEKDLVTFTLRY